MEETIEFGIEDIIIVTCRGESSIKDLFDFEFEENLRGKGKYESLDNIWIISEIKKISNKNDL